MKVITLEQAINEIKSLDNDGCITRSTNHICEDMRCELKEFDAIPIDRIKQAREEMAAYIEPTIGQWTSGFNNGVNTCIEILDRLIEEGEK